MLSFFSVEEYDISWVRSQIGCRGWSLASIMKTKVSARLKLQSTQRKYIKVRNHHESKLDWILQKLLLNGCRCCKERDFLQDEYWQLLVSREPFGASGNGQSDERNVWPLLALPYSLFRLSGGWQKLVKFHLDRRAICCKQRLALRLRLSNRSGGFETEVHKRQNDWSDCPLSC